ncbi:MAG TPA: hypothetical protein VGX71_05860 [Pseudaminobacter sp.]|nr:hypothetical protein [Pseudaminobacter sp.]
MDEEAMVAIFKQRQTMARILGVHDTRNHTDPAIPDRQLGQAIQFIANAPADDYDVRRSVVFYGQTGSLNASQCAALWARFGAQLIAA